MQASSDWEVHHHMTGFGPSASPPVGPEPGEGGLPEHDPARLAAIQRAQTVWTGQLVDLGGRNTLLYYKDLKVGTLDLGPDSVAEPLAVEHLLGSHTTALSALFPSTSGVEAAKRARTIRAKASENFEERGLHTLFLAWGMATWASARSLASPAAPVLLRRAALTPRGRAEDSFELSLTEEWEVNLTFLYVLRKEFEIDIRAGDLLSLLDESGVGAPDPSELYERLTKLASGVPGFSINSRVVLGNFSYAKWEMVKDLEAATDALVASDLLCAIAGYQPAQQALRDRQVRVDPSEPDLVPPKDEFLVVDADASQSYAINAVVAGCNLVIEGPPGTGKSQTIANLIASLAARGQHVLFVAEKRAAIDAVLDRLAEVGLSDVVLDLHDGVTSKRKLAHDLAKSLADASSIPLPAVSRVHEALVQRRADLVQHDRALHSRREPWGVSVYELQSRIIGVPEAVRSTLRLRGSVLQALDANAYEGVRQALRGYVNLGGLRLSPATSPWAAALAAGSVPTAAEAQGALNTASSISTHTWPQTSVRLSHLLAECGLQRPPDVATWSQALQLLDGVAETLEHFEPSIYGLPLAHIATAMAPAASGGARLLASITNGAYRSARKQLRGCLRAGAQLPIGQLLGAARAAAIQRELWAKVSADGGPPRLPSDRLGAEGEYRQLATELRVLGAYVGGMDLGRMPTDALGERLNGLVADAETLYKLPELTRLRAALWRAGLGPLVEELAQRNLDVDGALGALQSVWAASALEHISMYDSAVGAFAGAAADRNVAEFIGVDRAHIASTPLRVHRAIAERITKARDEFPEQSQLVTKQASLMRKFMPMRDLYQAAPDVLRTLKPCFAMSPLVVSQLLPMQACFDVAIFDEASQITPFDAAGVLARTKRVVVAGDPKQLPPTTFFTLSGGGEDDEDSAAQAGSSTALLSDVESVLDQMAALLPSPIGTRTLGWHYRSKDERLIAFSNAQESLYDYSMTTFPGVLGDDAISHIHVPFRPGRPREDDSASEGVAMVIKLIAKHARSRPEDSLGVIAMGIRHANRIEESLRRARREDDELEAFYKRWEPTKNGKLFVKNLERVQGDERDAIILTIGYTKTSDGRMQYHFSPLNQEGGERRLNVAVTRARKQMTTVSSFTSSDLDPTRLHNEGTRMLARYLAYAESGGASLGEAAKEKPDLNSFERDVELQLTKAGIPLVAQWGCSGYWIDFAARHPTEPGRMVLAIECDGATYHSSATARDRDRLRQEHLERLGWRFHRIWSTEWFRHREVEVCRALATYRAAVAALPSPRTLVERPEGARTDENIRPAVRHGPMPVTPGLGSINAYHNSELVALIRWIKSDTLLRTQSELLEAAIRALGFQKRGRNIVAALEAAIVDERRLR